MNTLRILLATILASSWLAGGSVCANAQVVQLAEFSSSDGAPNDSFGASVAVSGNTVVAGAPFHTKSGTTGRGAAYVFLKQGSWPGITQVAELIASDGTPIDEFATSVSISGDTIAVGSPCHFTVRNYCGLGAVYVFVKPKGGWRDMTQTAILAASDGYLGDQLGFSIAMSGTTIVAGAPLHAIGGNGPGAAYVFTEPASGWTNMTQTAELTSTDLETKEQLGESVAISGNTVVAGAPGAAGNSLWVGAAYVFVQPASGWSDMTQTAKLTASNPRSYLLPDFGYSVSIDGGTIAASAPYQAVGQVASQGAVYMFAEPGGGWIDSTESAELTSPPDQIPQDLETFGSALSLAGKALAAGASGFNYYHGSGSIYVEPAKGWTTTGNPNVTLKTSDGKSGDDLGASIALGSSPLAIFIGAPGKTYNANSAQGAAYVFGQK